MVLGWGKKTSVKQEQEEDMSMEEILASIRKYVSEENLATETDSPQPTMSAEHLEYSPYKTGHETSNAANQYAVDEETTFAPVNSFESSTIFNKDTVVAAQDYPVTRATVSKSLANEETLASDTTFSTVSEAFSRLAEATTAPTPTTTTRTATAGTALTLDQLFADLAKPMIKSWIDQNLAPLVEKMVGKEIERITRR